MPELFFRPTKQFFQACVIVQFLRCEAVLMSCPWLYRDLLLLAVPDRWLRIRLMSKINTIPYRISPCLNTTGNFLGTEKACCNVDSYCCGIWQLVENPGTPSCQNHVGKLTSLWAASSACITSSVWIQRVCHVHVLSLASKHKSGINMYFQLLV